MDDLRVDAMRPARIGIAGYMGAGKSVCARACACAFGSDRVTVIDADAEAKALMLGDHKLRDKLRGVFGDAIIANDVGDVGGRNDHNHHNDLDNDLRFDVLGRLAFADIKSLRVLNDIVHPPLVDHLKSLIYGCNTPICLLDAALIPLWGIEGWFDHRIWVDVPFEERYQRLKKKVSIVDDGELLRRMRVQEELMGIPQGDMWIKLSDDKCRQYISVTINSKMNNSEMIDVPSVNQKTSSPLNPDRSGRQC